MKKILATVIGVLCFYNSAILSACNDINVSNGTSSFTSTESSSSGNEILTDEPPMPEDERPVIEIGSGTQPFTKERTENILLRNVPKTTKRFDADNVDVSVYYNGSTLSRVTVQTEDINDVFAFFDGKCRNFPSDRNALLVLPDTSELSCFKTTYRIEHNVNAYNPIKTYYDTFDIYCQMEGVIRMPNGLEYNIVLTCSSAWLAWECYGGVQYGDEDLMPRYICYDGDAFLSESYIEFPETALSIGQSSFELAIFYKSENEENPYEEKLSSSAYYSHYYSEIWIYIRDGQYDNEGNNPKLTEEESALAFGQIYETIKDSFIVYDYEHYKTQFDGEKNG